MSKYFPCPCDSGLLYTKCCKALHEGNSPARPVDLMRSRYAAFALGLTDYIIETTHPNNSEWTESTESWKVSIENFSRQTRFLGLKILETEEESTSKLGGEDISSATVTFLAKLARGEEDISFTEKSLFEKLDNKWKYLRGEIKHSEK